MLIHLDLSFEQTMLVKTALEKYYREIEDESKMAEAITEAISQIGDACQSDLDLACDLDYASVDEMYNDIRRRRCEKYDSMSSVLDQYEKTLLKGEKR